MIFYFTATGNSLYAAKELDDEHYSIAQEIHGDMKYTADSIGIVCPVFGHEMPPIVKDFIESAEFDTDYLYLILTYGNRHGGAADLADEYARSVGKQFDYINVLLMVDNFLPGFDMEQQMQTDKHIPEQLDMIRWDIAKRKHFISEVTDADRAQTEKLTEGLWSETQKCLQTLSKTSITSPMNVSAAVSAQRSVQWAVFP